MKATKSNKSDNSKKSVSQRHATATVNTAKRRSQTQQTSLNMIIPAGTTDLNAAVIAQHPQRVWPD